MRTLATTPAATYADRDALIRYANRHALPGDRLHITYDNFDGTSTTHPATVSLILPGPSVRTIIVDFVNPTERPADIASDMHNNLTDANIIRVELYR